VLYREALRHAPRSAAAHFGLGESLARMGRWHAAGYAFREAVRLCPSEAEYLANLAVALGRSGRWPRAAEALHRLAVLCPAQAEPRLLLAASLSRAGQPGRAMRAFREAAPLAAPASGRLSRLGELLVGASRWRSLLADHASASLVKRPARPIHRLGGLWQAPRRRRRRLAGGRRVPRQPAVQQGRRRAG
jgi:cytochrome c-type biogenesis protein CcmH/NrfG